MPPISFIGFQAATVISSVQVDPILVWHRVPTLGLSGFACGRVRVSIRACRRMAGSNQVRTLVQNHAAEPASHDDYKMWESDALERMCVQSRLHLVHEDVLGALSAAWDARRQVRWLHACWAVQSKAHPSPWHMRALRQ